MNSIAGSPGKFGKKFSQQILNSGGNKNSNTKPSMFQPKGSQQYASSPYLKNKQQPQGFQFTDNSRDQRMVDAEIREKYRQQLNQLPGLLGEEQFDESGNRIINQAYNPLVPGNVENPEFFKNLYTNFKMTRMAQGENLSMKYFDEQGNFNPNLEGEEFENFRKQIKKFAVQHGKCGEFCKHLLRFYQKLGFFPQKKYEN